MVGKENKGISVKKNNTRFKKLKIKIEKKRKEKKRKTLQNYKNPMQRQRFMTTIKNVTEEKEKNGSKA